MKLPALILLVAQLVGCAEAVSADDGEPLRIGSWSYVSTTAKGSGNGQIVTFAKSNDQWTITLTKVSYTSRTTPVKEARGPFAVSAKNGSLVFKDGEQTVKYTYAFDTNDLILPALVRVDDRTWRIKSPNEKEAIFRCEFDPFTVPVGKAEFRTSAPIEFPRYYSYERLTKLGLVNDRARQLRFMVRYPDGSLYGNERIIWDEYGGPRLDAGSWFPSEVRYSPVSAEEFKGDGYGRMPGGFVPTDERGPPRPDKSK